MADATLREQKVGASLGLWRRIRDRQGCPVGRGAGPAATRHPDTPRTGAGAVGPDGIHARGGGPDHGTPTNHITFRQTPPTTDRQTPTTTPTTTGQGPPGNDKEPDKESWMQSGRVRALHG